MKIPKPTPSSENTQQMKMQKLDISNPEQFLLLPENKIRPRSCQSFMWLKV